MTDAQLRTEFDVDERERIRRALLRYMEKNRMGTPTLQVRIIAADVPRHREIPLSTLQRFLSARHHTQDHHVALCHAFVRELPFYGEGRDFEEFGAVLNTFLRQAVNPDAADNPTGKIGGSFYGSNIEQPGPGSPEEEGEESAGGSWLTLTPVAGKPFLEARELVRGAQGKKQHAYEGVMIYAQPQFYAVLRNSLNRRPKLYSLETETNWAGETALRGHGFETDVLRGPLPEGASRSFQIKFRPFKEAKHYIS